VERVIRAALASDVPAVLELIRELAAYEREPDAVETTEEMLSAALLGPAAVASCHVAEHEGAVVGFALWYVTFSTWKGRPGLWLEDLYVQPAARGFGYGKALLQQLAGVCAERGYARFEWWVLDWNVDAQGFYRSLGARPEDDWTVWRVDGDALAALGSDAA
jgi:GNAT superfamily N-acetyltransferase